MPNKKGMHDMEYASFIFNIFIEFVCSLQGLLHLLDVKKDFVLKTSIIGSICGKVVFIFYFVFTIMNGIVYTTYYDYTIYKRDSDGIFAEKKEVPYSRNKSYYFLISKNWVNSFL